MQEMDTRPPVFRAEEQQILVELLERERRQLAVEIRHTDARHMREELTRRLNTIDGLYLKLSGSNRAAAAGQ